MGSKPFHHICFNSKLQAKRKKSTIRINKKPSLRLFKKKLFTFLARVFNKTTTEKRGRWWKNSRLAFLNYEKSLRNAVKTKSSHFFSKWMKNFLKMVCSTNVVSLADKFRLKRRTKLVANDIKKSFMLFSP